NEYETVDGKISAYASEWKDASDGDRATQDALLASLKKLTLEVLELLPADTTQLAELVEGVDDLSFLAYLCAANLDLEVHRKQSVLELPSVKDRALELLKLVQELKGELEVQGEIRDKMSQKMGKLQRESILREQLKTIREELGESEAGTKDDLRKKIEEA